MPSTLRDDPDVIARFPSTRRRRPTVSRASAFRWPKLATIIPHKPGASYIYRENNRRFIPIKFSVRNRDLASAIAEAQDKVDDPETGAKLPTGYDIEWSGEFAQMQEANARLMWIVPLSIGLIIDAALHGVQLDQGRAAGHGQRARGRDGGRLGPLDRPGTPFSISAAVGFVSVFGVAVQDGVCSISYFNQMRSAWLSPVSRP